MAKNNKKTTQRHVIMFGPDLGVMGGISFVVRAYHEAKLHERISLEIIPTTLDGSKARKISYFIFACIKTLRALMTRRVDICHIHVSQNGSFYRKFVIFCIAKLFRKKIVPHIHGSQFADFMTRRAINRRLCAIMFTRVDLIITLSEKWATLMKETYGIDNVVTLYNPVNRHAPLRKTVERNGQQCNVLFLGRLSHRKGIYDLLQCIKDNKAYFVDKRVRFILAGDGDVSNVRTIASSDALEDLVVVPGWVSGDEKTDYLSNADLYLLPSYNEQMPMSILEAMAYGLPIISTYVAGIPEMVETGKNGFLIHPGDRQGMAQALKELIENREKREIMGKESIHIVAERFDGRVIIDNLLSIYDHLYET